MKCSPSTTCTMMEGQDFSMHQEERQDSISTESTGIDYYTNRGPGDQLCPAGYTMDPDFYQQQYDITIPFGIYSQSSSIEVTRAWEVPHQQHVDRPSRSPVQQALPPLVPRLSKAKSLGSSEGDETSDPTSPQDEASEKRKERRRAQNRAAQRAFRARKEDTIKESSARLEALQGELIRLQSANSNLLDVVGRLRCETARLLEENAALKGRSVNGETGCNYDEEDEADEEDMKGSPMSSLEEQEGAAIGFSVRGGMVGAVQWQDTGGSRAARDEVRRVAEGVLDAAASLTGGMF